MYLHALGFPLFYLIFVFTNCALAIWGRSILYKTIFRPLELSYISMHILFNLVNTFENKYN